MNLNEAAQAAAERCISDLQKLLIASVLPNVGSTSASSAAEPKASRKQEVLAYLQKVGWSTAPLIHNALGLVGEAATRRLMHGLYTSGHLMRVRGSRGFEYSTKSH